MVFALSHPYTSTSPWNTPIGSNPDYDPNSNDHISALAGYFGSDPTQYTFPLYEVDSTTPTTEEMNQKLLQA